MVSKVDEFNAVILALDDNEVASIINALRHIGNDELACEVEKEVFGGCEVCDCGDAVDPRKSRPAREWLAEWDEVSGSEHTLIGLTFDVDTSALEVATVKLTALAEPWLNVRQMRQSDLRGR